MNSEFTLNIYFYYHINITHEIKALNIYMVSEKNLKFFHPVKGLISRYLVFYYAGRGCPRSRTTQNEWFQISFYIK